MIKIINNHLVYTPFAFGKKIQNNFVWQDVKWVFCYHCGLYHSNRRIPREYWSKFTKKNKRKAGIILLQGDNIYITQSYNNKYGFPKGTIEVDEKVKDAAVREMYEESGYKIDKEKLTEYLYAKINKIDYHFFIVRIESKIKWDYFPLDDVETTAFGWINVKNVLNLDLSKPMKTIFLKFKIKYLNS